jgi:Meckel syndrome type 1 protein
MLELPSASASSSAPSPAVAAAARASDKESTGFQGRLREVLDASDVSADDTEGVDAPSAAGSAVFGQQEGVQVPLHMALASPSPAHVPAMQAALLQVPPGGIGSVSEAQVPQLVADATKSDMPLLQGMQDVTGKAAQAPQFADSAKPVLQNAQMADSLALPVADQKPTSAPIPLPSQATTPAGADQLPGSMPLLGQMAPAQGPAAANQQSGQATSMPQAGQVGLAPVQPSAEQHAIISSLVAGQSQAAVQPVKAAPGPGAPPKVVISPPAEALEASKSAMPNLLLAQSLAAEEAALEAQPDLANEATPASFQVTAIEAPKTTLAKHTVDNETHIIPGQAFGLAFPDGASARADAPIQSVASREVPAPPPPVRQLAPVIVSLAFGGGNEALTITLDPGELGRVEISIGQGKEAGLVRIIAERPETLALLQRDQRELDRSLTQAGLGDMARSLSFSLASDQGRQQQHHAAQEGANRFATLAGGQEAERPLTPIPAPPRASNSLIDLAV